MQKQTARRRSPTARKPIPTSTDWERRHIPSPQLHESEKLLVGILAFLLVFLPWALGSTYLVAQAMACFIALTALGAALLPRHGNTRSITSGGQIKRLFSFPVFWLGSLLLLYISIQGFNTAWKVEGTDDFRILAESSHQPWLPAGVAAGESGPFQSLLIFGTPLLAVCAAWVGITRRKSLLMLLGITAINALFIAGVGFYQIAKNKTEILWLFEPPTRTFLASFPYHWQGATYLTIVLAASVGLAAHHYVQARRTFTRSNPSGLFIFVGLVLTLMAIFSISRLAAALSCGLLVAFLAHIGYRALTVDAPPSRKALLAIVSFVVVAIGASFGSGIANNYIERGDHASRGDAAIASPAEWTASWQAGAAMIRERPVFGWGAGSFPDVAPHIARDQEIAQAPTSLAAEYSASDWVRFPAELGVIGTLLLLLIAGYLTKFYLTFRTLENPLVMFLLLGCLAGLLLGLGSLVFHNLAVITTWSLLLVFGACLIRVEQALRSRGDEKAA